MYTLNYSYLLLNSYSTTKRTPDYEFLPLFSTNITKLLIYVLKVEHAAVWQKFSKISEEPTVSIFIVTTMGTYCLHLRSHYYGNLLSPSSQSLLWEPTVSIFMVTTMGTYCLHLQSLLWEPTVSIFSHYYGNLKSHICALQGIACQPELEELKKTEL